MKFLLIDRIIEFEPGRRIVAQKALSLAEEYLADHFPKFPVLPGVLNLEAMVQACAWVVRAHLDFEPSLVLLKEARNVTFRSFVAPGQILTIVAHCRKLGSEESSFDASGRVDEQEIVKGRLTLRHITLASRAAEWSDVDEQLRARQRELFKLLWKGCPAVQGAGTAKDN